MPISLLINQRFLFKKNHTDAWLNLQRRFPDEFFLFTLLLPSQNCEGKKLKAVCFKKHHGYYIL